MIWSKQLGWLRWRKIELISSICLFSVPQCLRSKIKIISISLGALEKTKDKPEPRFWSQVHCPDQKVRLFLPKCRCNGRSYDIFSPKNWLPSCFPGNDPWQNQGHSCMIAHSCGLHSLDNTSSTGFKVQRMSTFCSQMTNLSEWSLFFPLYITLSNIWPIGNVGPYRSREAKVRLTSCWMLVPKESRENATVLACIDLAVFLTGWIY